MTNPGFWPGLLLFSYFFTCFLTKAFPAYW